MKIFRNVRIRREKGSLVYIKVYLDVYANIKFVLELRLIIGATLVQVLFRLNCYNSKVVYIDPVFEYWRHVTHGSLNSGTNQ